MTGQPIPLGSFATTGNWQFSCDNEVTTTIKPGERFIAVKPGNPPDITIAFNAEHKVSIQLGISAGVLETN
jgi:hypothetical protein